jgi:hypothetical protein
MYYWYARMHENRALASLGNANARYDAMQTEILDRRQDGRWTDRTLGPSYGTAMAILSLSRPSRD